MRLAGTCRDTLSHCHTPAAVQVVLTEPFKDYTARVVGLYLQRVYRMPEPENPKPGDEATQTCRLAHYLGSRHILRDVEPFVDDVETMEALGLSRRWTTEVLRHADNLIENFDEDLSETVEKGGPLTPAMCRAVLWCVRWHVRYPGKTFPRPELVETLCPNGPRLDEVAKTWSSRPEGAFKVPVRDVAPDATAATFRVDWGSDAPQWKLKFVKKRDDSDSNTYLWLYVSATTTNVTWRARIRAVVASKDTSKYPDGWGFWGSVAKDSSNRGVGIDAWPETEVEYAPSDVDESGCISVHVDIDEVFDP